MVTLGEKTKGSPGPDTPIHACGSEGVRKTVTLGELMPFAFGPANLET